MLFARIIRIKSDLLRTTFVLGTDGKRQWTAVFSMTMNVPYSSLAAQSNRKVYSSDCAYAENEVESKTECTAIEFANMQCKTLILF